MAVLISSSFVLTSFLSNLSLLRKPMFSLCLIFTFSIVSVILVSFSVYKRFRKKTLKLNRNDPLIIAKSLSKFVEKSHQSIEDNGTHLSHSLLLEILPSDCLDLNEDQRGKKRRKKGRKKRANGKGEEGEEKGANGSVLGLDLSGGVKQELVCLYPFTSLTSATQRKIKQQYDQLVKCHDSKGLTLAQVGQFANCLIEARTELQHKSEVIQRKFTITKALLYKADRSSFDRLRKQIYKLELEQKRLEEDAFVYNWLQQQLKLSPAYKKMLEIGACMELKAKSAELMENTDPEVTDISFEEFLAQEKKDSFWQKNTKSRSSSN